MAEINYSEVKFIDSVYRYEQLPAPEFPEIAFAGRSNVGKSSLINKILNRKGLVKVSSSPGKTQSLNYFLVGKALYLVDLPGYGYVKVSKKKQIRWSELITEYLSTRTVLKVVVVIFDIRHTPKKHDLALVQWLRKRNIPFLPVYNKIDKLSGNERNRQSSHLDRTLEISKENRVLFSARTGHGKKELLNFLDSYLR